ncbi:MAG: 23S rRNA (guanosine(2251)-2'-O)-methyltransferase RlmB [Terriglobia bacterium]
MKRPDARPSASRDTLYGIHAVEAALGQRPIDYVLVAEGHRGPRLEAVIATARAHGVPVRFAPKHALDRMAGSAQHQNVLAVCAAKDYVSLEALLGDPSGNVHEAGGPKNAASKVPLLVFLDGVEDPANLGAVARTALAAGATGIVIPERRAAGLSASVARAAAGALEHMTIARVTNLTRALIEVKGRQVWTYGFEAQAEKSYLELDYSMPCALVFGGEGRGLHRLVREACDQVARIPLYGPVESLNVSVAAAVALYEAARQRRSGGKNSKNAGV